METRKPDIELSVLKSVAQQIDESLTLIEKIKSEVKINEQTQAGLNEIKVLISTISNHKQNVHFLELEKPTRDLLAQLNRLSQAILNHPSKFQIMNKGDVVNNTINLIKKTLNSITEVLVPKNSLAL